MSLYVNCPFANYQFRSNIIQSMPHADMTQEQDMGLMGDMTSQGGTMTAPTTMLPQGSPIAGPGAMITDTMEEPDILIPHSSPGAGAGVYPQGGTTMGTATAIPQTGPMAGAGTMMPQGGPMIGPGTMMPQGGPMIGPGTMMPQGGPMMGPGTMMPGTSMPMEMGVNLSQYTYPANLNEALDLIRGAVSGEREDELFYDYIIGVAPNEEAKNIIRGIRDDERKHNKMFRRMYTDLTRQTLPPPAEEPFERPASYCDAVRKALLGELGAVQRYRKILFALQNRVHINMITEIITDELRHGNLYNLLFSSSECGRR